MLKKIGAAGVVVWWWKKDSGGQRGIGTLLARALAIRHRAVTDYDRAITELIEQLRDFVSHESQGDGVAWSHAAPSSASVK